MPKLLKNIYSREFISRLCGELVKIYPKFNTQKFTNQIFNNEWQDKELKSRMTHIAVILRDNLPDNYLNALKILTKIVVKFVDIEAMYCPEFVAIYGMDDYQSSIKALAFFTRYSSAEFAVRPFIEKYPKQMLQQLHDWAKSDNEHLRRLASEGCRPRLPWANALNDFKKDPTDILSILEILKTDKSLYVRRSVANNLNDISKDHPKIVLTIAKQWLGQNPNTDWLIKHASRTLLKQGDPIIMKLFGFTPPTAIRIANFVVQQSVQIGDKLAFSFMIKSNKFLGKLRIEYAIFFQKKNGSLSKKVFKISESINKSKQKIVIKSHSFRRISTRKYYAGNHRLALLINGYEMDTRNFLVV